uniref:Diguanylate cyclase/phosphodiesterase with PAS/PAC sensor n=1 Tax=uncultured Acidobacteriota bacterium TaxID=171953 RepID=G8DPM5_9BACT|nr:diguanylate cyclase/phosphodiesterase with PAS/PAC sensor [uncultured Acidobacteriota bacterium]
MFNINNLQSLLHPPDPPGKQTVEQLRDRISELELENSSLRRLEETIRKNSRLFEALLEKCQEGIGLITPDLMVLRLIHSLAGYEEVDVSGQPFLSLIHPDDASCFQEAFSTLLSAPAKGGTCEFRFKKKDGNWTWVECQMTDMSDDPDVQAILMNSEK